MALLDLVLCFFSILLRIVVILYIKANVVSVCLSVWTKIGQCLEDSSSHYTFLVERVCSRWQNRIGEVITRARNQHPWHIFSMRIERTIKQVWCALQKGGGPGKLRMKFFYAFVPIMFSICFHMFPIMFPKFSMFLRLFPTTIHFITYVDEPNGRHSILTQHYFGDPDDGPIEMDH